MTSLIVVATGVSKMWTDMAGLRPTDLSVSAGEVVAVRGRSGSGKSTLLAVLAGWCEPDTGSVLIDGRRPGSDEPWSRISLMPQSACLASELTVVEAVGDALTGTPDAGDLGLVDEWLAALGLREQARRLPSELSSGQQQRASLARAGVVGPRLLLADEPTSFQDTSHADTVLAGLRRVADSGAAVVVASHSAQVIASADRVIDLTDDTAIDREAPVDA